MNIKQRFEEYYEITRRDSQAAATLVLAEVIQGTTHAVDLTIDGGTNRLNVEVGGDERYPIQVENVQ